MIDAKALVKKFEDAGLELRILSSPMGRGNRQIVQFDVKREAKGTRRVEWFNFWPGNAEDNDVQVLSSDKTKCQVLVMVSEGKSTFTRYNVRPVPGATLSKGAKVVKTRSNGNVDIQESTTGKKRKYLMGRDERMLFMCEVKSNVTNMQTALASLKPDVVVTAEGQHKHCPRQGEWLFIPASASETKSINDVILREPARLRKKQDIAKVLEGRDAVKPHTASEVFIMPAPPAAAGYSFSVRQRQDVYVRGVIKHEDHPTRRLPVGVWHKVIRNGEVRDQFAGMFRGSTYID